MSGYYTVERGIPVPGIADRAGINSPGKIIAALQPGESVLMPPDIQRNLVSAYCTHAQRKARARGEPGKWVTRRVDGGAIRVWRVA